VLNTVQAKMINAMTAKRAAMQTEISETDRDSDDKATASLARVRITDEGNDFL